ncbi:MAG TPA: efflux RND transporter periplasmic adaptor subunit [Burkholderiaceae bacterium]|nr:efflux RND transporter periplasmic adaptor subunit [Burkholderiaceae bacterium]
MTEPRPAAADGGDPAEFEQRRRAMRRTKIAALVVLALLAVGAGRTVVSRIANARTLDAAVEENTKLYVRITQPRRSGSGDRLSLPGTLQGNVQAPIAARANGYLKRWTKDIGSRVERGELLAEIETPEIDQQLSQAIAARDQAAASLALSRSTVERWEGLRKKDVVSQQDLDERRSAVAQQQASLAAADANVQRLRQLEGFKRVLAPFAGVITRRNVDVGDLIDGAGSRPLFLLAQTDPLRVYVNVPQTFAQLVKAGQPVVVTQAELRGHSFQGVVARTAASIDAGTRTMQVEVALPNPDGRLLPGAYVQVALPLASSGALTMNTNTLMFRGEGTLVAVVDAKGKVALRKVAVGRNFGDAFEVLDGVTENDRVVLNPPDWLAEGQIVALAPAGSAPAASPPGKDAQGKDPAGKDRL